MAGADSENGYVTEEWLEFQTSSGMKVLYGPFPFGMYWDIMEKGLDQFPDPPVPQKEIKVLDGTEMVDDEDDPEYQVELKAAVFKRNNLLGQACLEFCVEPVGGMEQYEPLIQRMASEYVKDPVPENPTERKVWFLKRYAFRTATDWNEIIRRVQNFSQIREKEVRDRVEFFRGKMEGPEGDGADAPGPAEK